MTSAYLERKPRTQMEVLHQQLERGDVYLLACFDKGEATILESPVHMTLAEAVAEIAEGQCIFPTVAVIRFNLKDREPAEIIANRKLARAVAEYVTDRCDHPDQLWACPYLDENYPYWREEFEQQWNGELAGMASEQSFVGFRT